MPVRYTAEYWDHRRDELKHDWRDERPIEPEPEDVSDADPSKQKERA